MNADPLKRRILTHLAEQGVPGAEDPWQAFQRRLAATDGNSAAGRVMYASQRSNRRWRAGRRGTAVVLLLLLLMCAMVLAIGSDRALAQNLLRFFVPGSDDLTVEKKTTPEELPGPAIAVTAQPDPLGPIRPASSDPEACSSEFNPKCTFEQAQTLVDFPLMQFQPLPEGIYFTGAAVEAGRVTAMYRCSNGCLLWLEQTKGDSPAAAPSRVGSSARVETVQWEGIQGEYVEGSYYGEDGSWNSGSGAFMLRWQQGEVVYTISAVQPEPGPDTRFTAGKESFIQLASSLTADFKLGQPLNPVYLTRIEDARALADFSIVEPGSLPEGYHFSSAIYEASTGFVCLQYAYNGASYPSLFIRQSPTAALTELEGYPGSNMHTVNVALRGADGEASLTTGFAAPDGACDADKNIFRAAQALLWRAKGTSFEIYAELPAPFLPAGLEQDELIRLAESLMAELNTEGGG